MRQDFNEINDLSFLVGETGVLSEMASLPALPPFDERVLGFLNDVSRTLMSSTEVRRYPDVVTFAFWIRRSSTETLKARFRREDGNVHLGRGVAFHIAPSNVPVNFAYTLAAGLLTGNANVVRVPSKGFSQVELISRAIAETLGTETHAGMRGYVCLVRYGRSRETNDQLSAMADVRIVWGGDATVEELRKSPIGPRAGEITFADRCSIAVIDSDAYLAITDKDRAAEDFYNDTYLTDQNACTSPRLVVWTGERKEEAKKVFWTQLHELVQKKYVLQPIQSVNKLTSACLLASVRGGVKVEPREDNLIVRVRVEELAEEMMAFRGNSGYFFEYDCENILELRTLCDGTLCQTVSYIGSSEMLRPLLALGIKGIDRVVPVGRTMDFDLIWDGYDLCERLTRTVSII